MSIKVIVFDFDGTIADTQAVLLEITNRLAPQYGYLPLDPEEVSRLKNLTSREIIKQSKIPRYKIPFLLRKVQQELGKEIERLQPIPGLKSCLLELKNRDYQLGIITSNFKPNVINFLKQNQLDHFFEFLYSETTIFGKHRVINKFLKQQNFKPEEMIYIGDETRDIEAARKSKVKIIAVTWGFNSDLILAQNNPDYLINQPQEILEIVTT
jgi:HAD superfamily hydrolase (TIGR01549 family)